MQIDWFFQSFGKKNVLHPKLILSKKVVPEGDTAMTVPVPIEMWRR